MMIKKEFKKENICAIIVVFNGYDCLYKTVESIINQVTKVVLVDNNSNDRTKKVINSILEKYKSIHVIWNQKNLGIAAAFNQGSEYAKKNNYDFILTLDQDSEPSSNMIEKMLKTYRDNGSNYLLSICPRIIQKYQKKYYNEDNKIRIPKRRFVAISSGQLINIKLYDVVGKYNEELFIDSVDFDYCLRINLVGGKIVECPSAILFHQLGYSVYFNFFDRKKGIILHNPIRYYYMVRNHIYIIKQYFYKFPLFCFKKNFFMIYELIKALLFQEKRFKIIKMVYRGVKDGIFHNFGDYNF